jgi:hypothetical protein
VLVPWQLIRFFDLIAKAGRSGVFRAKYATSVMSCFHLACASKTPVERNSLVLSDARSPRFSPSTERSAAAGSAEKKNDFPYEGACQGCLRRPRPGHEREGRFAAPIGGSLSCSNPCSVG